MPFLYHFSSNDGVSGSVFCLDTKSTDYATFLHLSWRIPYSPARLAPNLWLSLCKYFFGKKWESENLWDSSFNVCVFFPWNAQSVLKWVFLLGAFFAVMLAFLDLCKHTILWQSRLLCRNEFMCFLFGVVFCVSTIFANGHSKITSLKIRDVQEYIENLI